MLAKIHEQKHLMQQNLKVTMLDNILPKIEQYSICDNEELFNFHKDWMTKGAYNE